jgi:glycosyltransferase involved in cell wall biosynthesis
VDRPELTAVLPDLGGGGAQRVVLTLINGLASRGRRVELIAFDARGPLAKMPNQGVPVRDLGCTRLRTAIPGLLGHIRKQRPRVVFSSLGYVNLSLAALKPFLPTRTRLWLREANLPSISLRRNPYPWIMRQGYSACYPWSDRIISSSERMKAELMADFGIKPSLIHVLPNPVDIDQIRREASSMPPALTKGPRLVAVGRLTAQKGFDRLIEMFAQLDSADCCLVIAGDGPLASELHDLAYARGVADRIEFTGFISSPWALVASADAFMLPSRWEGMPNAALEALACGVPVIATPESGGISEVAEQSPLGAVTVAEAGPDFIAAMRRVPTRQQAGLRPSLLPPAYRMESVIDRFEKWLDLDT